MESIKGTTARLRRTFQYPTDDSSTDSPEVMDEEEQETLIQSLADQNTARNAQYTKLLVALPLVAGLPHLITLFSQGTFLVSILSLSSLVSTAYLAHVLPPTETGIPALDAWMVTPDGAGAANHPAGPSSIDHRSRRSRRTSFSVAGLPAHRTPLEAHLPLLNGALAAVLVVMGLVGGGSGPWGVLRLEPLLPGVVYGVVIAAKMVMAGVDPERDLAALRYEYKGA